MTPEENLLKLFPSLSIEEMNRRTVGLPYPCDEGHDLILAAEAEESEVADAEWHQHLVVCAHCNNGLRLTWEALTRVN